MKGNEMLFEIIHIHCGLWVWFQCYTGEIFKSLRSVFVLLVIPKSLSRIFTMSKFFIRSKLITFTT